VDRDTISGTLSLPVLATRSITGLGSSTFNMTTYQITQNVYTALSGSNPSSFSSNPTSGEVQGLRPVDSVSWYDAVYFCNLLSAQDGLTAAYNLPSGTPPGGSNVSGWNVNVSGSTGWRLPYNNEWQHSYQGGITTTYYWGGTWNDAYGWVVSNSGSRTHEVGLKTANGYGLYDMSGNVWEWCQNWYTADTVRELRGGSWYYSSSNATSSYRNNAYPYSRNNNYGLRLVRP
jgi:formylglycine-generating enzyme required for sulfatase activity